MFGVLNLNKPAGVTSRDVVNVVQRLIKPIKVGHAGTLDPMATGVLLVCVGPATRLISHLQRSPKTYVAQFRLGQRSDTDDSTGEVTEVNTDSEPPSEELLLAALKRFEGDLDQVPPAYSAVKVSGKRAYSLARKGDNVQLKAKRVHVYSIKLLQYAWPNLELAIECGSGTYIRSIARDLGEALGCGGLMSSLQRTHIGQFAVKDAINAQDLTNANLTTHLTSPVKIVQGQPVYRCTDEERKLVVSGRSFTARQNQLACISPDNSATSEVSLTSSDGTQLLAIAEFCQQSQIIQPRRVFTP